MKLTDQQGQRLTAMMLAMRPDWIPNKPGAVLIRANEGPGFPAADFGHCIRALAAYATETKPDGTHTMRTPNVYPEHGRHWTNTAPETHETPNAPKCQDHDTEPAHNCRSCLADVKVGDRHPNMIGKRTTPTVTPGRSPRPNTTRNTLASPRAAGSKQQLPMVEALGASETAPQDPERAIPHTTPTDPHSTPKNQNGATS